MKVDVDINGTIKEKYLGSLALPRKIQRDAGKKKKSIRKYNSRTYLIWDVSFSNIGIILIRNTSLKAIITSMCKYEKDTLIEKWTRE